MMNLEKIMDKYLEEHAGEYNRHVVSRVRSFVRLEEKDPEQGKAWYLFDNIYDWVLYHRIHPEWQGLSPADIKGSELQGLRHFYNKLLEWCHVKVPGEDSRSRRKRNMLKRK